MTKNSIRITSEHKGATPIEKNVIVVDASGNEYEATYPKRAKGLVKKGDLLVVTAGIPIGQSGDTNMIRVMHV